VDPNLGFDGGVLEVSTDGGNTFQDVLAVGGSFVTGGYNRTISNDRGSPITGRQAWSGNSEGFITTAINLPIIFTHERLRWRVASDNGGSSEGWRIDTVRVIGCAPAPCITPLPRPSPAPRPVPKPPPSPHATPAFTPHPRPTPKRFTAVKRSNQSMKTGTRRSRKSMFSRSAVSSTISRTTARRPNHPYWISIGS